MLLHHRGPHGPVDIQVDVLDPEATVADLAVALDPDSRRSPLCVDGRVVPLTMALDRAPIGNGSTITTNATRQPTHLSGGGTFGRALTAAGPSAAPLVEVTVVGGLDAGRRWLLAPGTHTLGRTGGQTPQGTARPGRLALLDRTVSRDHLELKVHASGLVEVRDLHSRNGSWSADREIRGVESWKPGTHLRCGASTLRLTGTGAAGARTALPGSAPPWPWHRKPVQQDPDPVPTHPAALAPPEEGDSPLTVTPVGVFAVVASILVGMAMVVVLGSWMYAAFALLGPAMMLAGSLDGRIRRRRSTSRSTRARRLALEQFEADLSRRRSSHLAELEALHPGPGAAVATSAARADGRPSGMPGPALWTRRRGHPAADIVRLGTGTIPWNPHVPGHSHEWANDVAEAVDRHRQVTDSPVVIGLRRGPVAVVGPPEASRAVARSIIVQAATARGPADLRIAAIVGGATAGDWVWLRWLPHSTDPATGSLVSGGEADSRPVVELAVTHPEEGVEAATLPDLIVVVEDDRGLRAGRSPARSLLRCAESRPTVCPIVLVGSRSEAPPTCTIVEVGADGTLDGPPWLLSGEAVACGTALDVASDFARSLARFHDPEVQEQGANLPDEVGLSSLVGLEAATPSGIAARWRAAGSDPRPVAVIGRTPDGPLTIDLTGDGPHTLVAGTTGAGKSELLRTLVASLAVNSSPRHLNFVLVDFKGGSAFDACERLPHTAGMVTDLDGHLAARALRCLEAELRYRETRLRIAAVTDLSEHRAWCEQHDEEPIPRLVVVVDEFATMAAELPGFIDSLVGVAQRGRSLGVHLILATQRPSGSISENIKANTSLRIALRMEDEADSVDVVGVDDAAGLPRSKPGRAVVRLGPRELVAVQTAWTGRRWSPDRPAVVVRPLRICSAEAPPAERSECSSEAGGQATDLDRIVCAAAEAWRRTGSAAVRRPWPDPLPEEVDLNAPVCAPHGPGGCADTGSPLPRRVSGNHLVLGLVDDPDAQRQTLYSWDPTDGALLLVGSPGSGTTTGLATAVLSATTRWEPADLHVHVIDMGSGELSALAGLPHVGAVVGPDELERQRRLLTDLAADLAERRADPGVEGPRRLLVLDGITAFHDRWDDLDPTGTWPDLLEVVARGAEVGIHSVLAANGGSRLPHQLVSACARRLVLRLSDPADAAVFGISPSDIPELPPGRGLDPEGIRLVQLGRHRTEIGAAVAAVASRCRSDGKSGPRPVGMLPDVVAAESLALARSSRGPDGGLRLVVGISDVGLDVGVLLLPAGCHALVAGPHRSGRSTTLRTMASAALDAGCRVVAVTATPWRQDGVVFGSPEDADLTEVLSGFENAVILVDDADTLPPDHPALSAVVEDRRPGRHVVAAVRADRARTAYSHWIREVRADRRGILLQPDPDLDGELTGARLPRTSLLAQVPGRGWLTGAPEGFVQVTMTLEDL